MPSKSCTGNGLTTSALVIPSPHKPAKRALVYSAAKRACLASRQRPVLMRWTAPTRRRLKLHRHDGPTNPHPRQHGGEVIDRVVKAEPDPIGRLGPQRHQVCRNASDQTVEIDIVEDSSIFDQRGMVGCFRACADTLSAMVIRQRPCSPRRRRSRAGIVRSGLS